MPLIGTDFFFKKKRRLYFYRSTKRPVVTVQKFTPFPAPLHSFQRMPEVNHFEHSVQEQQDIYKISLQKFTDDTWVLRYYTPTSVESGIDRGIKETVLAAPNCGDIPVKVERLDDSTETHGIVCYRFKVNEVTWLNASEESEFLVWQRLVHLRYARHGDLANPIPCLLGRTHQNTQDTYFLPPPLPRTWPVSRKYY